MSSGTERPEQHRDQRFSVVARRLGQHQDWLAICAVVVGLVVMVGTFLASRRAGFEATVMVPPAGSSVEVEAEPDITSSSETSLLADDTSPIVVDSETLKEAPLYEIPITLGRASRRPRPSAEELHRMFTNPNRSERPGSLLEALGGLEPIPEAAPVPSRDRPPAATPSSVRPPSYAGEPRPPANSTRGPNRDQYRLRRGAMRGY